jgi:hypothetical protein
MNLFPATPFGLPDAAPDLARRFAMIMAGLGALVARRFVRMPHLSGFTILLWTRLNRVVRRFYRALTNPSAKPRAVKARTERREIAHARPVRLPSAHGWLVRELGWEAAAFMGQLEALLSEVKSRAALADAPRAVRVLRPICRLLGVHQSVTPVVTAKPQPFGAAPQAWAQPGPVDVCDGLATSG